MSIEKTIVVTRPQLIDTTRIMSSPVTSLMVGDHRIDAIERLAGAVFDRIASVPFTPTPLASTAMAAAREQLRAQLKIHFDAAILCGELADTDVAYIVDLAVTVAESEMQFLQAAFQPLLAKVEGEKTAAVEQSNFDRRVTENMAAHVGLAEKYAGFKIELAALRADLAAKEAAQPHEEIIALADATLAHLNPACQAAVSIRYARDLVNLKRLASRASCNVEGQK